MSGALMALAAVAVGLSAQQSLVEGFVESTVRVLIYEDLQCPDSAMFRRMLDEKLLPRYATRVAFVHRDFPLSKHAWARKAGIAAHYFAAMKPQLGLAYRKRTLATISQTTADNFAERLSQFARENGLDAGPALEALGDSRLAALVDRDFQDGVARGVTKTPTVFVGGQAFIEQFSVGEISQAIDDALAGR
jgi:protein-disulfide isomerase